MNDPSRRMKPEVALAFYRLEKLPTERIVELAHLWLEEGIVTDSLILIATQLNPVMSDIGQMFEKAIEELKLQTPDRYEAAISATINTIQKMVSGEIDLMEGASFLYQEIYNEISSEFPDKDVVGDSLGLEHVFCWLREVWDCRDGSMILYYTDLPRDQAEDKFLEHLKEEAEKWLETNRNG